ncbi:MAG TPA: hypothetical protein VFN10_11310 [Thermoanaerobaculia bacterium]|nr:hypothetical protein [Thermoanaerobaculia bacterium]
MTTTRSRMLLVFIAAAVIVSLFMDWHDFADGFRDGWNDADKPHVSYKTK